MPVLGAVPSPQIADPIGIAQPAFYAWLNGVFKIVFAVQQSGTTAERPTSDLFIGRPYFDTTLGKPIWVKTISPVLWVDAAGASA